VPKARLSLSDVDRERLKCPEWIEVDIDTITIDESIEIADRLGLDPVALLEGWTHSPRCLKAIVWLALRRSDVEVPLDELTFRSYDWSRAKPEAPAASTGKGRTRRRAATPAASSEPS
jgi:hypothetical protein